MLSASRSPQSREIGIIDQAMAYSDKSSVNLSGFFLPRVDGEFIREPSPAFVQNSRKVDKSSGLGARRNIDIVVDKRSIAFLST